MFLSALFDFVCLFAFCAFAWLRFCAFGAFGDFGDFGAFWCFLVRAESFCKKEKQKIKSLKLS